MRRRGFTLLEVMIAIVILAIALTLAWQTFSATTRAWTSARALLDRTHHGDFVMAQLSSALRSMVFFDSATPDKYGFRMDRNSGDYGEHSISWVTDSGAFIPRNTGFEHGLHRIEVGAGRDDDGREGLMVTVWPHLADEEDVEKQSWVISENVKGLSCMVYNIEEEQWDDEWEDTNAIPGLIGITLYTEPFEEDEDPVEYHQLIEIPLGPPVTNEVDSPL
jgi:prepilin-type N-terminal cleavage/methylation domain-containing protein